jgi:hypothetical protein
MVFHLTGHARSLSDFRLFRSSQEKRLPPMEMKPIIELTHTRFATIGDLRAMNLYHWFEQYEESNRLQSRRDGVRWIDLWQRAIELRARPFLPGESVEHQNEPLTMSDWEHFYSSNVRMFFLAQQVQTSKAALDTTLDSYYSQSFALIRVMLESWRRCVLMRKLPNQALRWIPEDHLSPKMTATGDIARPAKSISAAVWSQAFPCEGVNGTNNSFNETDEDCLYKPLVTSITRYLDEHVHPTLEGSSQLMTASEVSVIHPAFSADHFHRCIRYACIAEYLLLRELILLLSPGDDWVDHHHQWNADFNVLCGEIFEPT